MATSTERTEKDNARFDRTLFRRILSYLSPYKGWVVLALILNLIGAFLGPLTPYLVQIGIDDYIVPNDTEGLFNLVLLLVAVLVGQSVFSFVNGYLTQWIGQNAIFNLRVKVFDHIQRLPLRFFDNSPIGRLITRTTSDVEALSDILSAGIVTILGSLFNLFFITYFMFALNWKLALFALSVMPIMIFSVTQFRKKVREAYRETRKQVARLNSFLQEHVTGMKIVQVFNREREELKRFESVNNDHRVVQVKTVFYYAIFWPSVDIIASLALGLVIWYGGGEAIQGTLTLGVLVAFTQYVRQFFDPIRNLSDQYNTLQSAMAASERIFNLLDNEAPIANPENPVIPEKITGRLEFKNVWFSYEPGEVTDETNWVLKDVSFTVEPGSTVALVGPTGSGKSTIINLLLRFYEIQRGQILIDGIDIRDMNIEDLRNAIGLVLQDVFLFSGSVERNIRLGNESIPMESVRQAAALVGAEPFIDKLPEGYDQDVRERGTSLSHGQRQLLSFARALAYNPAILVLDEATSSIDTETEELIQTALDRLFEGRTSLVVAHRLSTIQHADQILVIHRGGLREKGNHQELLALNGLYRRLYELQYKEQEALNATT